jgi:hypothetical protein
MIKDFIQTHNYSNGKTLYTIEWKNLSVNDFGETLQSLQHTSSSVQVTGTFGEKGSVLLEGSNDGVNFFPLSDSYGSLIHFNKAGLKSLGDTVAYLRPKVIEGDSTTFITTILVAKV